MRSDTWLVEQLPVVMGEDDFLRRFLGIFQSLADTVLDQIDALPDAFDPTVAPPAMVREMGRWIGIDWLDSSYSDELQRKIVIGYAELLPMRGTRLGLTKLLELLSGDDAPHVTDSGGVYAQGESRRAVRHITMSIASTRWTADDDVIRIIRQEMPVNATFELHIGGRVAWPPPPPTPPARPDAAGNGMAPS